jgi:hypothetical protein
MNATRTTWRPAARHDRCAFSRPVQPKATAMSVMHDVLRDRVMRHLEALPEAQLYQALDYIEFMSSKYNRSVRQPGGIQRFGEVLEDKMRQQGMAFGTIRGALSVVGTAGKVVSGITDAGRSVVREVENLVTPAPEPPSLPPAAPPASTPPAGAPAQGGGWFDTAGRMVSGLTEAGRTMWNEVGAPRPPDQNGGAPPEPVRQPDGDPQGGPPAP